MSSTIHIPRHPRDTTGTNQREGLSAETLFHQVCRSHGWDIVNATRDENYKDHIDCWVHISLEKKYSVDVKAPKRVARRDRHGQLTFVQDKLHWVEWCGRSGMPGWVRGKAYWIAFGLLNGTFLMVHRQGLQSLVESLIRKKGYARGKSQWDCTDGILWNRRGNKDRMTLLNTNQLRSVPYTWTLRTREHLVE